MNSDTVKTISQGAFVLGAISVIGSAVVFFRGLITGKMHNRDTGLFLGLWAPTLFTISEMLDRISIEDERYMGVPISGAGMGQREEAAAGMRMGQREGTTIGAR
jgi:hypothetical protein